MNYESAKVGIENSLKKSGLEYFDLYLLHQATRDYFWAYRDLEEAKRYGVIAEAWIPLGGGRYDAYNNPILKEIADKYHKTIAQVLLRWGLQKVKSSYS